MARKKTMRAMLGAALVFGVLSFPQLALASDDNESEHEDTPSPSPSASKTYKPKPRPEPSESPSANVVSPKPEDRDDDDDDEKDDDRGGNLGDVHDDSHDISTPPLLIRPELPGSLAGTRGSTTQDASGTIHSKQFYSAPLGFYLEKEFSDHDVDNSSSGVNSFDTTANPPVIENIIYSPYASPADEFMSKSYLGLGALGVAASGMTVVVLRRGRTKDDDIYEA